MSSLLLRGGLVVDPAQHSAEQQRDLAVRDGRIVEAVVGEVFDQVIDASGCVVMAGGIDMHTHIGGGKMNLARLLMAEDHRDGGNPIKGPTNPLELASCGSCAPGTLVIGYRYIEMGYPAAFEPAMVPSNARHAHMEMGDVPILDHGADVMLGNDELFLQLLAEGGPDCRNFAQLRDYTAWTLHASKAIGVKVVNENPQISVDVGQTVTASGDTMRQHANTGLANPRKWVGADIECMAGCGVVPFRYREQSYVNALQWVIGLGIFLLVRNPWQVVLTTDHPNGGPFTNQRPAPDPLADGPQLPRRATRQAAPGRGRELRPGVDHPRADAGRDRDPDPRWPCPAARPGGPQPARHGRGG